jgi:sodium-independent sulfate anion transporter 11
VGRVVVYDTDKLSTETREIYLPLDHADGSNPSIPVEEPLPGVFIYRPRQSPLYPSVPSYTDQLVWVIQQKTKRTNPSSYPRLGDRPWNLPGPRKIDVAAIEADPRPTLKAIIWDFTTVEHIDVTAAQILQDVRAQLDRHASPDVVEWHFAGVSRPWVKRALVAAGFGQIEHGYATEAGIQYKPMFSIAKVDEASDHLRKVTTGETPRTTDDVERVDAVNRAVAALPVLSLDRSAFHIDVPAAVASVTSRHGNAARGFQREKDKGLKGVDDETKSLAD